MAVSCALLFSCTSSRNVATGENAASGWVKQTPAASANDSVTIIPGANFKAGKVKTLLAGEHYRHTWLTPVTVPLFRIEDKANGLKPLKAGGNMQSLVLHMEDKNGRRYVLRSVQKNPVKTIPEELRRTFVLDLAHDQVSTMHPYGALGAARLAEVAGVYHTNPQLVYVQPTPGLGQFERSHGGMLALFEEKPEDDWSHAKHFGNSRKIVGTDEVIAKTLDSSSHRVDQRAFARARLLDILIGDWDRSEDQWAWATFTSNTGTVYKPIPRDRDQAFVKMDGFFPWLFSRKWAARKYQGFDDEITDMRGLNWNAKWIDRSFLTQLTASDWKSIADSLKSSLTDDAIEKAISSMPASGVYGPDLIAKLKLRRDKLGEYAMFYYKVLADEVTIPGTKGSELFEVVRMNDHETSVRVYKCIVTDKELDDEEEATGIRMLQAEKQELLYERIFNTSETDEIRLYGLDGSDVFEISGEVQRGIVVRAIGGEGYDRLSDRSEVNGLRKRTKLYDIAQRNEMVAGDESKDLSSYDVRVNDYDRMDFQYDHAAPKAVIDYNRDDGLYLGGGFMIKQHGFRKKPCSQLHELVAATSVKTQASLIRYKGDFIGLFRKWDLQLDALVTPYYSTMFFGLGNETRYSDELDEDFNLVRLNQVVFRPAVKRWSGGHHWFTVGPQYRFVEVRREKNTFVTSAAGLAARDFEPRHFGGLLLEYKYRNVDELIVPRQGVLWTTNAGWTSEIDKNPTTYSHIATELSGYIPLPLPFEPTLALRIGGARNFEAFEFYQANYLGGFGIEQGNLRGYRRNRFAGRASAYQNTELRLKLVNFRMYGEAGVFGFVDHGRVWMDNERSETIHRGYGGGLWAAPFNRWVVTGTYAVSSEDSFLNISMGFFF